MLLDAAVYLDVWMWLFVVVFLLLDGEEIVTMERWVRKHGEKAKPALDLRLIDFNKNVTAQFAVAVLVPAVLLLGGRIAPRRSRG
ncbi:hypothetical protein D3P09_18640 [Paenibacillus pinisoli]|uniref:Uncharacterized protein n=1 Tax=Paenibacillus pinisoli TaxID=1276110 RepID=A0A3A6PIJ6_9BACL|nr:hypothetical protein [Paenibacillus pinisoli]RJX38089.1 hypothetical protein D3P09_18640 [Paenibacillus pinisoli]